MTAIDKLSSAAGELAELRESYAAKKREAAGLSEEVMRSRLKFGEYETRLAGMEALRAERDSLLEQLRDSASRLKSANESLKRAEREAEAGKQAQETLKLLGVALAGIEKK